MRTSKCEDIVFRASVNFPSGIPAADSMSVSPFDTQNSWSEAEKADWAFRSAPREGRGGEGWDVHS